MVLNGSIAYGQRPLYLYLQSMQSHVTIMSHNIQIDNIYVKWVTVIRSHKRWKTRCLGARVAGQAPRAQYARLYLTGSEMYLLFTVQHTTSYIYIIYQYSLYFKLTR